MPTGGCPKQPVSRSRTTSMKRRGGQISCLGRNTIQRLLQDYITRESALFSYLTKHQQLRTQCGKSLKVHLPTKILRLYGWPLATQRKTLDAFVNALASSSTAGKPSRSTRAT